MPLTISSEESVALVIGSSPWRIPAGRPAGRPSVSAEAAVAGGGRPAVMVAELALVFGQQPVEPVVEQVDGRVHVHARGIGLVGLSGSRPRGLCRARQALLAQ